MSYPEVKRYSELYDLQNQFANQTARITAAYTSSFSVLYIFDIDQDTKKGLQRSEVDTAIQKILAVQSELLVYENVATGLDREYSETLQKVF
jgi:hypothetical protein